MHTERAFGVLAYSGNRIFDRRPVDEKRCRGDSLLRHQCKDAVVYGLTSTKIVAIEDDSHACSGEATEVPSIVIMLSLHEFSFRSITYNVEFSPARSTTNGR